MLHDMFGVPFDQIAPIVGRSEAASRQLASRARRRVRGASAVSDTDPARQREVVDAFLAAAREGDFDALLEVLDPDVVLRADGGTLAATGSREVRGARAVAGLALGYSRLGLVVHQALVNGTLGLVSTLDGRPFAVGGLTVANGRIVEIDILADPERLAQLDLAILEDGPSDDRGKEMTMRVFVAGATGAIGTRLVPKLVERGHKVIGTSRSMDRAQRLHTLGAVPVALDLLDRRAVREAVLDAKPDAIIHQATALTGLSDFKHFDRSFHQTNLLRTEGTDALLAAAKEAGVSRIIAQSFASYRYAREGGPVKTEDDPLDPTPVAAMRETEDAMAYLDRVVTEAGGIALRYGGFYGDPSDTTLIDAVRARKFPIVGSGEGVSSFIHLDDAADATVLALDLESPAIFNIVDDEPAPIKVWLPELARILRAKPPRHFPTWLARIFAGEALVMMATEARGASNAKAKRELGWTPAHPTWRQGFAETYAATGNRGR